MGIATAVGDTGYGRTDDVTDGEDERTFGLGELNRRERVGCLAGLGYSDNDIVFVDDGFAVAELRGVFYLDGYLRELLDRVHSDETGMPGSAAGGDNDAFGVEEALFVVDET